MFPIVSGGATERFACSRMQLAFWRSCQRQVITQADTEGEAELESGHLWHMDSRSGQSDFAASKYQLSVLSLSVPSSTA